MMQQLYNDFNQYLVYLGTGQAGRKSYMKIVYNHFAEHEFLSRNMLIPFKIEKRNNKNKGFNMQTAKHWINFLEGKKDFFQSDVLSNHIRKHRLWSKERYDWRRVNRWAHPNAGERSKEEYDEELKKKLDEAKKKGKKKYTMKPETKQVIEKGFRIMVYILGRAFEAIVSVRKEMEEDKENEKENAQMLEIIDLTGDVQPTKNRLKF